MTLLNQRVRNAIIMPKTQEAVTVNYDTLGYCGVDCSACDDFLQHNCLGCRRTDWAEGDLCAPIACCTSQGIRCCGECADFPCGMMDGFYQESESHRMAFQLMQVIARRHSKA